MALMVTASPLLRSRPPPDPSPFESPLLHSFSPSAPPESPDPPDPPDAVYLAFPLRILKTSAKLSLQDLLQTFGFMLACPDMVTKFSSGGDPIVFSGDTSFAYVWLFPVVYMSHCRAVDGFSAKSYLDLSFPPLTQSILQVHPCPSFSGYLYSVELVGMQVAGMTLDCRTLVLVVDVLMDKISFSSTLMPLSGIYVVSVRPLTAVCSFFVVSSLAFGAVILFFSSWWQMEENLIDIFQLVNMVLTDMLLSVVSCLEQFLFPIFSLVWSKLEVQALLVLQGSSSQLSPLPAFGAVFVIIWITLGATFQKAYKIVMQFLWFLCELYQFYHLVIKFLLLLAVMPLLYPPLMESKLF